jgi:hypothetical protein
MDDDCVYIKKQATGKIVGGRMGELDKASLGDPSSTLLVSIVGLLPHPGTTTTHTVTPLPTLPRPQIVRQNGTKMMVFPSFFHTTTTVHRSRYRRLINNRLQSYCKCSTAPITYQGNSLSVVSYKALYPLYCYCSISVR